MAETGNRRPRRLMSIDKFKSMLEHHTFVFTFLGRSETNMPAQEFFTCVKQDRELIDTAWQGGDEYIQVVKDQMQKQLDQLQKTSDYSLTAEEQAFETLIARMNPEQLGFFEFLEHFDWYWSYSDDIGVGRRGMETEKKLKEYMDKPDQFYGQFVAVMNPRTK